MFWQAKKVERPESSGFYYPFFSFPGIGAQPEDLYSNVIPGISRCFACRYFVSINIDFLGLFIRSWFSFVIGIRIVITIVSYENHFQDFELNFVELPKFQKTLEELKNIKDKWIYFVKNAGNMTMIPKELEEPKELREAFETANQMKWTKDELDAYDARGIYIQDERGHIEYALEEGKKIGLEEGKKIGVRGREVEIARELKKNGVNIDIIVATTGFTKIEIENL